MTGQVRSGPETGGAALGVLLGIVVAVAPSIGNVFRRAWWPYQTILGRVPGIPGYHDIHSYRHAQQLPGCRIFRFAAPVFFANARTFREQVTRIAQSALDLKWVIVAAEPITDVDTTAADMLRDLDGTLDARGTALVFTEMKDPGPAPARQVRARPGDRSDTALSHSRRRDRRIPERDGPTVGTASTGGMTGITPVGRDPPGTSFWARPGTALPEQKG